MTPDARRILGAQGLRAFVYGLGSVLLGVTLEARNFSGSQVGLVLAAVVAGTVGAQLAVARYAERWGRRRCYGLLYLGLAAAGLAFARADQAWVLVLVALTGTMSTEVVETGAFTSLEQAMLSQELAGPARTRVFGVYNAVAALAGSIGALAAGGPAFFRELTGRALADRQFFLLFVPVALGGALLARTLSPAVEHPPVEDDGPRRSTLVRSRPTVIRLSSLMAIDSFAGGFVVQAFLAFWFRERWDLPVGTIGAVFFGVGLVQTASFLVAPRIAERIGLLPTMVASHLPSNLLLASVPLAPRPGIAIALLLARSTLSQMDVPTRQAYVMALVDPAERTAAAAYTNTVRYIVKPVGALLAGAAFQVATGLPFFIAGGLKATYDIILWRWFRTVELPEEGPAP